MTLKNKPWFSIVLIIVGVCIIMSPAAFTTIKHGMDYGWPAALKSAGTAIGTVLFFAGGAGLIIYGFHNLTKSKKGLKCSICGQYNCGHPKKPKKGNYDFLGNEV